MPSAADLPRHFQRPPGNSRFAGYLLDSEVIQRGGIAESPVKCAFRGVCPSPIRRARGSESRSDEILAMGADRLHSLLGDVLPIRFREVETTPELRLRKTGECGIVCACVHDSQWLSRLRRVRHPGSLASMNAWNLGPCPCAFRWVSSWTTTYSTSSRGIPASISE